MLSFEECDELIEEYSIRINNPIISLSFELEEDEDFWINQFDS